MTGIETCGNAPIHKVDHEPVGGIAVHIDLGGEVVTVIRDTLDRTNSDIKHMNRIILEYNIDIPEAVHEPQRE